jgi:hypothetical protein
VRKPDRDGWDEPRINAHVIWMAPWYYKPLPCGLDGTLVLQPLPCDLDGTLVLQPLPCDLDGTLVLQAPAM